GLLKAKKIDFLWKASDWVIQEIGLAIGKNLKLILLLEDGLQKPGGLQGDLEYISFDPQFPERCFGKIVEMINALSPRLPSSVSPTTDARSPPIASESEEPPLPKEDDWWVPKPQWGRRRYELALFQAIEIGRDDYTDAISEAYLNSDHARKADAK